MDERMETRMKSETRDTVVRPSAIPERGLPGQIALGCALMCLGVALGAFGAHALRDQLSAESLAIYQTGVQYQQIHALALLFTGLLALHLPEERLIRVAGTAFAVGIVLFSGSLYALALSGVRVLGAITPLGGVAFLTGWILLTVAAVRKGATRSGARPGEE